MSLLRFLACAGVAAACCAEDGKSPKEILALMHRVNDWQKANPVMKPMDRNWERGTWYTGVMAAWKSTKDRRFFEQALAWGELHEWRVGTEMCGANRLFCVQTWLEIYFQQRNPARIAPAVQWLETDAPNSPAGAKRWYLEGDHSYVDSLYGAAALAMLAKATGDRKYVPIMHAFFDDVTGELFDKDAGLYYRDNRFKGKPSPNGRKILWSRGNGWAFAGIARILDYLPKSDPRRADYIAVFRRMAAELIRRQPEDGLWRSNLDDPAAVPNPETSGTGFFCFGLAWGVNNGLLDRKEALPAVRKAWAGLVRSVSPEGKVRWGQQVDAQPNPAKTESSHEYVTGTFLLAASQMYELAGAR